MVYPNRDEIQGLAVLFGQREAAQALKQEVQGGNQDDQFAAAALQTEFNEKIFEWADKHIVPGVKPVAPEDDEMLNEHPLF